MSVDKNVVMMAEQVGLFLAPTLRSIVGTLFTEAVGGLLGKMAELQSTTEKLRADMEVRNAAVDAAAAELRGVCAAQDVKIADLAKYADSMLATKADLGDSQEAWGRAVAKTNSDVEAAQEACRETRAASEQQVSAIKDTLRDLTNDHGAQLVAVHRTLGPLSASVETLRQTLDSAVAKQSEDVEFLVTADHKLREELTSCVVKMREAYQLAMDTMAETSKLTDIGRGLAARIDSAADRVGATEKVCDVIAADLSGTLARLAGLEMAMDDTRKVLAEGIEERVALKQTAYSVQEFAQTLQSSLVELQNAEPRTVTIKSEPDPALIDAAIAEAVKGIKVPVPDMRALADEARTVAIEEVNTLVPNVREALAANVRDEVSRAVAALPVPKDGKDGEPGPAGQMGAVEPFIEGCIYERLALVSHAGGAWQATRRTKAAPAPRSPDWQAIAAGVSSVAVHATNNLRSVEVIAALTNGDEVRSAIEVPAMVYRDVYSSEAAYDPADVVTYAGSMWIALKETTGEQPSKSPEAWRLVVKRGQEGKDGKDGAHGVQFQAGFEGEYEENRSYSKNTIVTYASSIWMSKRATKERPPYMSNQDNEHWLRLR